MTIAHVALCTTNALPEIDTVNGPPDGAPEWPHCTNICQGNRNDRVCPLMTQYQCFRCNRVVAYLIHGLRSGIKRRFYGETKIIHMWPNFQDESHIYCSDCARACFPNLEKSLGKTVEKAWKEIRNYDHVTDTDI